MNRYLLILGFWALAVLGGCTRSEVQGEGDSWVTVSTATDPSLNIKSTKADSYTIPLPDDYTYTVRHKGDKTVVAEGESTAALGTLALMAGNYLFEVASVGEASLDKPSYAGSTAFAVQKGKTTAIEVKATLASAVVEVRFSEAVKSGFASYQATINYKDGAPTAVFDASTPEGTLVYLPAPASQVTCTINVVSKQGVAFQTEQTVETLAAADLLSWMVDIPTYTEKPTDPLVLELVLDRTLNEEKKNFTVPLNPSATGVPVITGRFVDLAMPIGVKYKVGTQAKIDLATKGGLAKVLLMFPVGQEPIKGCSPQGVLDVMALSEPDRQAWGIAFAEGGSIGAAHSLLDLSAMTVNMPGSATAAEKFKLTLGLLDQNGTYVTKEVVFNVYGVSLTTLDYLNADKIDWFGQFGKEINKVNVRLQGQYNVDDVPDDLAFQYRKVGQSSGWEVAEPTINTTTKAVYAVVPLVADGSTWEYRLSSAEENGATKALPTLPTYPQYTNLSLDAWGGGTRANPDNWGSPNYDGVIGIGVVNSTSRQTGRTGVGYAARIVSGDAAGKFASGGLFTGTMDVNINAPYKSAQVGKPFAGRPKQLVGYFKYKSVPIHRLEQNKLPGNGAKEKEPDMCEIAVKLERWDGSNYSVRWRDGFFGNPGSAYVDQAGVSCEGRKAKVVDYDGNGSGPADVREKISVGYGKLTSRGQADWTRFVIDIEYFQDVVPDRLIITAVSSAYGGYMSGAEGSELWVDDLEFVY